MSAKMTSFLFLPLLSIFVATLGMHHVHGLAARILSPKPCWFLPDVPLHSNSCIVFLHGRLEAEAHEPPFPPPPNLYSHFCSSLAKRSRQKVLMVDYHEGLSSHLGKEPRSWELGPISQSIIDCLNQQFAHHEEISLIDIVTFSMGAAMGLKTIRHASDKLVPDSKFSVSKMILIEPVWRCWLSIAMTHSNEFLTIPVLAIWGTLDRDTLIDSGNSVERSLTPLVSDRSLLSAVSLNGGNHWYILNEDIVYASKGLPKADDAKSPSELREELMDLIIEALETSRG